MHEIINQYKFECIIEIILLSFRELFKKRWLLETNKEWLNTSEFINQIKLLNNGTLFNQLSDYDKRSIESGNITNWSINSLSIYLTKSKYKNSNNTIINKENNIIQKLLKNYNLIRSSDGYAEDKNNKIIYSDIKKELLESIIELRSSYNSNSNNNNNNNNNGDYDDYFTIQRIENILINKENDNNEEIIKKYFPNEEFANKLNQQGIELLNDQGSSASLENIIKSCELFAKSLELYSESISFNLKSILYLNLSKSLLLRYKYYGKDGKDDDKVYTLVYKQFLNISKDNAKFSLSFNPSNPILYQNLSEILILEGDYGIGFEFLTTSKELFSTTITNTDSTTTTIVDPKFNEKLLNHVELKLKEYDENCKNSSTSTPGGSGLTFNYKQITLKYVMKNRFKVPVVGTTVGTVEEGDKEDKRNGFELLLNKEWLKAFNWFLNNINNNNRSIEILYETSLIYSYPNKYGNIIEMNNEYSIQLLSEASLKSTPSSSGETADENIIKKFNEILGNVHSELGFRYFNGYSGVDIDIERSHYHLRESTKLENSTGYHLITLVGLEKGILSINGAIQVLNKGILLGNENCKKLSLELIDLEKKQKQQHEQQQKPQQQKKKFNNKKK